MLHNNQILQGHMKLPVNLSNTFRYSRQTNGSQEKSKEIDEVKDKNTTNVTNNSLFVSTSDLQKC